MKSRPLQIVFWFLTALTLGQVLWWAYLLNYHYALLVKMSPQILGQDYASFKRMIIFESSFFILLWVICLYLAYNAYRKELELQRAHNSFFAAISHELKTPLAVIRLSLDTLARPSIDNDKKIIYLDRANLATDKLLKEVETILQFTTLASLHTQMQKFSLKDLVQDCVEQINALKTNADLEISVDIKKNYFIEGAPAESKLILKNILENAIKYSSIKNKVSQIKIYDEVYAKKVSLVIRDNGIGMTKEEIKNAFSPFWRSERVTDDAQPGTGMGLALVRELSKKAGVQILLDSDGLNLGTTTRLLWNIDLSERGLS